MNLKDIILTEMSQIQKDKISYGSTYLGCSGRVQFTETESRMVAGRSRAGRGNAEFSFQSGKMKKFWAWMVVMVAQ